MKKVALFILMCFSLNSFAISLDYTCQVRYYKIAITFDEMSTSMFVTDRMTHETLYVGYVGSIERNGNFISYHFYPTNTLKNSVLTFDLEAITASEDKLFGFIDGSFNGFLIYDNLTCIKN